MSVDGSAHVLDMNKSASPILYDFTEDVLAQKALREVTEAGGAGT